MTNLVTQIDDLKKEAVLQALRHSKTIDEAAFSLGVSRATLYRLIKKLKIEDKKHG